MSYVNEMKLYFNPEFFHVVLWDVSETDSYIINILLA